MGLLALFAACLGRHSGQRRIQVGSPIANRQLPELEPLIGFFVNTLVLRTDLEGIPSLADLLGQVRQVALDAFAHQDVPFDRLVDELQPQRDLSSSPLFQAMFVLQNAPAPELTLAGLNLAVTELDNGTAKFDLILSLEELDGELHGWIEYSSDLFDLPTVERFSAHFKNLLAAAAARPEAPLAGLDLLGEGERQQLLFDWNDSALALDLGSSFPQMFERQVRRTPAALAAACGGLELSYAGLANAAHRLARGLLAAGLAPEGRVAVWAERGIDFLAAILAIASSVLISATSDRKTSAGPTWSTGRTIAWHTAHPFALSL